MIEALTGTHNGELAEGKLPTRIKLLAWGENQTSKGPVIVNHQTLAAINEQRARQDFKRIVIDFDHQSEPSSPTYMPSPRKHVGYGEIVCLEGDGIYLDNIVYTPAGKEYAAEYADVSPTVAFFPDSRVVAGITSVALCPNGAVHNLSLFSASSALTADELRSLIEQVRTLHDAIKAMTEEIVALKNENADLRRINNELLQKLEAYKTESLKSAEMLERRILLDAARRDGKALPLSAEQIDRLPVEELREIIARSAPGRVPLSARTPESVSEGGKPKSTIYARCGVKGD